MVVAERWEDQRQHRPANEDHPFGLLTLHWIGYPPVTVELDGHQDRYLAKKHGIAKRISVGIERERCIWEEGDRNLHYEKHNEGPARPARHELPGGKQEEDEH